MGKAAIGAALPALGGVVGNIFGGGGQDPSQTQTTQLDPARQAAQDRLLQAQQQFTNQPFNQFQGPRTAQFGQEFQQGADRLTNLDPQIMQQLRGASGGLGIGQDFFQNFLGGQAPGGPQFDAANIARFTNPFQQQQIDATRAGFGRALESGLNTVGDQFTAQGAFGGSRQGVAEGTLAGNIARQEEEAVGGIRQRGFEDAAQRLRGEQGRFDQFQGQQLGAAGQAANLGFGSIGQLQNFIQQAGQSGIDIGSMMRNLEQFGIGQQREKFGEQRAQDLQNLGVQQSVLGGLPGNQGTTTSTQTQAGVNPTTAGAGIGSILGSFFGGPGSLSQADAQRLSQEQSISQQQPLRPPPQQFQVPNTLGPNQFPFPVLRAGG